MNLILCISIPYLLFVLICWLCVLADLDVGKGFKKSLKLACKVTVLVPVWPAVVVYWLIWKGFFEDNE